VADLRAQPGPLATSTVHDQLQETQLLYGERVKLINTQGDWAFVEATEQREYTHRERWQGYPGWVLKNLLAIPHSTARPNAVITGKWATVWRDRQGITPWLHLPMGTQVVVTDTAGELWNIHLVNGTTAWVRRGDVWLTQTLKRLPASRRRQMIVLAAQEFIGDPYFWGGRSPHVPPPVSPPKADIRGADAGPWGRETGGGITGVDCSGLVNLAYRAAGVTIPRDAHEQYLRARKMARPKPADLVFLSAPNEPKKIVHVMLYAGDGWLIEGPGTGLSVRRIEAVERFGRPLEQLTPGTRIGEQTLFFGAYLP